MSSKTEPTTLSDYLKHEAANNFSRDEVTVLSGQVLAAGAVIGKVTVGAVTAAAAAGNTGDGTIGSLSAGTGAKPGVYKATCIEPATDAGKFLVEDPDGIAVGVATVAVAFAGAVNFTIADGAANFISGDAFNITVAAGSGKVKISAATATDGSAVACGVMYAAVDATGADKKGVIIAREALIVPLALTFDASVDDATKKAAKLAQLAQHNIIARDAA